MGHKKNNDLFSLLREVNYTLGRGPRQGLSVRPGQNKVLKILNKHDTMRQQDLLKKLGIRAGSLSELLRKLEKDEYITRERNAQNKSEIIVSITEQGRIIALESEVSMMERDIELFSCLEADEKKELIRLLNKLLETWSESETESEGERREKRWEENTQLQETQREINSLLEKISGPA